MARTIAANSFINGLVLLLSTSFMAFAQPTNPAPSYTPTPKLSSELSVEELAKRKAWRSDMLKTPTPKHGCFHLTYPNTEWQEVPCRIAPDVPYPMRTPPRPDDVGGSAGDFAAQVAGSISTAIGLLNTDTSISESGPGGANDFALQLNTNQLSDTSLCTPPRPTPKSPNCKGWQQFIFSNLNHGGFIQYWLINYFDNRATCSTGVDVEHGGCCPLDWKASPPAPGIFGGCYLNGPKSAPPTPLVTLTTEALADLNLVGRVTADSDTVVVAKDTQHLYHADGLGNILNLAGNWKDVEFNIVGDGNASKATFSDGSTINVRIDVGGNATCATPPTGLTAESNNLTIVKGRSGPCCTWTGNDGEGGIMFTESNVAGAKSSCGGGKQCLPVGSSCSITGTGCCNTFGLTACQHGVCAALTSPPSCNGVPRPTQSCSPHLGWHCCDTDGWVCGQCQN